MELIYYKQYCMLLTLFIGFLCDTVSIGCNSRLLADRILVPDTSFQHSSAATLQHGASAAREDPNDLNLQERAWCPDAKVGKELREFMEIDLGRQSIIKLIITKGRVAQSKGRQTTPYFYVKYRRELTATWFDYEKENGTKRLAGNQDAMTENFNTMDPPFVARYIRIYPYSLEPTKTCLKLELLGCEANGILEYKAPEGALLPETISPSHQQYNNNPSNERTRLLDTTYDSKSHKFRLFDNIQQDFIHDKSYQTIIEGGLGKLTDNDTEFKTSTSPFSSHKFIGWRRKSSTRPLSMTLSNKSLVSTLTSNHNAEMESDFLRIIFRFDMIYNFSSIRIYVSNDFLVGLTIPRNITVGFSFQDPSLYYYRHYGQSRQQKIDQRQEQHEKENPWSSSILYQLTPDKQNTDSRWIVLPIHEVIRSNYAIQAITKQISHNPGQLIQNNSDVEQLNIFGLGQFVEIRIFFNSQWLAVGEILFENLRMPNLKFQPERNDPNEFNHQEFQLTSTSLPYLLNEQSSTLNNPLGQTTTYILAIICSLLVILICFGLFCLFCVWGKERLHISFRHKFHRTNKRFSNSTQFDSNSNVNNKINTQNVSLLTEQLKINNLMNNIVVTTTNDTIGDVQYQFQHPQRCQESTIRLPSTTAYLGGYQFLTNNGITPMNINLTTNTLHQSFQPIGLDNNNNHNHNYPTHINSNNLFSSLSNEFGSNLITTSIPGVKSFDLKDSLPIVSLMTPNFIPPGSITPHFHGTYLRSDENILNNINYRKAFHDNSIYTSLPGSDCDSQPYAKVDTVNNTLMQQFQSNNSNIDLSKLNISYNHCSGDNRLFNPMNLPPPPSLPLPPTPEHLTTTTPTITSTITTVSSITTCSQTMNLNNRNEFNHDSMSINKAVNNTLFAYNSNVNKCISNNDITTWLDSNGQFISTSNPLFDNNLGVDPMSMNNINNFQNFSGVQNSEYSNSTTNGSNTYSTYYGTPNMLPISIPTVQMITIKR
ncbi:unnamed protein product [Schistosoma rodhaini]|nr:unnamed protein product [Schistosoma rodhaini]